MAYFLRLFGTCSHLGFCPIYRASYLRCASSTFYHLPGPPSLLFVYVCVYISILTVYVCVYISILTTLFRAFLGDPVLAACCAPTVVSLVLLFSSPCFLSGWNPANLPSSLHLHRWNHPIVTGQILESEWTAMSWDDFFIVAAEEDPVSWRSQYSSPAH